ncbi:MAG TPA: hypothetical protein P5509_08255 [Bacteroidales bacterium]|nr:hypothetical protein [Bacteroidales bacterium]
MDVTGYPNFPGFKDRIEWEEKHIKQMWPHAKKMVDKLQQHGINFQPKDGHLDNVIFKHENKEMKIAYHCFYRFSGPCVIGKEMNKGKQKILEFVPLTDELFYSSYWYSYIMYHFFKDNE